MGKRRSAHGQTYFQCDWTAFPMRTSMCYLPTWNGDRLIKRGSYCNWESAWAHANELYDGKDASLLLKIHEHIATIAGPMPSPRYFHYSFLAHFKPDEGALKGISDTPLNLNAQEFHQVCCDVSRSVICAVKLPLPIPGDGLSGAAPREVLVSPAAGGYAFHEFLTRPYMNQSTDAEVAHFEVAKRAKKNRETSVWFWPGKNGLQLNVAASTLFKFNIYGDAVLVQKTNEASWIPRERFTGLTLQQFEADFCQKRKRKVAQTTAMSMQEFAKVKDKMVEAMHEYEDTMSAGARPPGELAEAANLPPATGKELAVVARLLEKDPEKKRKLDARMG